MVNADPKLARMKVCDHGRHPPKMGGMGMRDHDRIQTIDAAIPEIRRNHLLSNIEIGMHPLRQTSGIDQQSAPLWSHQKNGVALANIDSRHLHNAGMNLRTRG